MTQLTEMALGGDRSISEVWKKFQWTRNKVLLFTMKKYEIPNFFSRMTKVSAYCMCINHSPPFWVRKSLINYPFFALS